MTIILAAGVAGMLVFVAVLFESPRAAPAPSCGLDCGFGFSWGTPINESGRSVSGCGGTVTRYCYSIEIAGTSSLSTSNVNLSLQSSVGTGIPWPPLPRPDTVLLISPENDLPEATFNTTTFTWMLYGNFTGLVSGGDSVEIITGGIGVDYGLRGDQLVLHGVNGISWTVPSNAFP